MVSSVSLELRMNGWSRSGSGAAVLSRKATVIGMRASLQRHPERRARLDIIPGLRHVLQVRLEVLLPADMREVHALAVHRELDLVVGYSRPRTTPRFVRNRSNREGVLAVERQSGLGENAADGAERQAFDVRILRCVLTDSEGLAVRTSLGIADRQRRDFVGRRQISLQQHRRDTQGVGDVVEAVRRVVGGNIDEVSTSSANKSRMALAYSARLNR